MGVFSDPLTSFIKVLTMMLGEFDFADNFLWETSPTYSKGVLQALFVIFFFLVSIIISNLIIGLTVSKTDELFKEAGIIRMQKSVLQVRELEAMFFKGFFRQSFLLQKIQLFSLFKRISNNTGSDAFKICVQPMRDAKSKKLLNSNERDLFSSLETSLESEREHPVFLFDRYNAKRPRKRLGKARLPDWVVKRGIEIIEARNAIMQEQQQQDE